MRRSARLLMVLTVCAAGGAFAQTEPPKEDILPNGGRLYLGGAGARVGDTEAGGGAVIGYQWLTGRGKYTQTFFGLEVLGVKAGGGFIPLLTGDFGLKLVAFPHSILRPYVTGNLGITMLLILPIPSLAIGFGVGIPLGSTVQFDVGLRYRRAFNIFDVSKPVDIGALELGLTF